MLLSFIIPVYNAERWIDRCLQSIIDAFGCNPDVEIIVVNDGSTDNSLETINQFKYYGAGNDKYPFIKVISQHNQGVSAARNLGLDLATGDYVTFVDADDKIIPENFIKLIESAIKDNYPDIIIGGMTIMGESGEETNYIPDEIHSLHDDAGAVYLKMIEFFHCSSCCKLYKRSLITQNNIRFPLGMKKGEDATFCHYVMRKISSLSSIPESVYVYLLNNESCTANFHGHQEIDETIILGKIRNESVKLLLPIEEQQAEIQRFNRITSFRWLTTIYGLYKSPTKNRRFWLNEIIRAAESYDKNWLTYYKTGNPRIIKALLSIGTLPPHVLLTIVRTVPSLRKRLRG